MNMTSIDEITMRLVHYFVTKENYQPIIVNGLDNEIWLENIDKKYGVIRINSNYIHNKEQLDYDLFKAKTVVKQIKKKTLSFGTTTLSILLNVNDSVKLESNQRNFDVCAINDVEDLESDDSIASLFPEIKNDVIKADDAMDFFINVTNDINNKTEEKNKLYEKTFRKKIIVVTNLLIIINVVIFMLEVAGILNGSHFGMNADLVKGGEYYRLLTSAFFHTSLLHLVCNMYSLYIIGTQLETVLGKIKFLCVYLISAIMASLLSGVINGGSIMSVGASGAIFGLMGAMLYFGYHYRLYLGSVMISQIVPIIVMNLFLGFMISGVDNFGHIGGLVGGLFAGMMVGVEGKSDKVDAINGTIVTTALTGFLLYMLLFR